MRAQTLAVLGELKARMDNRGSGQSGEVILGEWSRQPSHLNDSGSANKTFHQLKCSEWF